MRSDTLHAALRAFAEEAAGLLAADTAQGAEVPFELAETGPPSRRGARTPLYCYRPLVGEFVRARGGALEMLPAHRAAAGVLSDHADRLARYLSAVGERPAGCARCCGSTTTAPWRSARWRGRASTTGHGARVCSARAAARRSSRDWCCSRPARRTSCARSAT